MIRVSRPQDELRSSHPLALAHLTAGNVTNPKIVEWTTVRKATYKRTGERVIRHVLSPITPEHLGYRGIGPLPGLGDLGPHDVGRTLVIDVPDDDSLETDIKIVDSPP